MCSFLETTLWRLRVLCECTNVLFLLEPGPPDGRNQKPFNSGDQTQTQFPNLTRETPKGKKNHKKDSELRKNIRKKLKKVSPNENNTDLSLNLEKKPFGKTQNGANTKM